MCFHPLRIRNPRVDNFQPGLDKPFLHVPCGHCPQCESVRSDEWYIRSYFEFRYALLKGGFVQFFTLTYSPNRLPTYNGYPCFSRSDVQKYLKRVRMRLVRYFDKFALPGKDIVKGSVRYLITCEYGDQFHRPHYHCLFFLRDSRISQSIFKHVLLSSWPDIAYTSKTDDGVINNPLGMRYVCSYISKSDTFMKALHSSRCKDLSPEEVSKYRSHCMPWHLQSSHYGLCALERTDSGSYLFPECVSDTLLHDMRILVPRKKGLSKSPLPFYYRRKLYYNGYTSVHRIDGNTYYRTRFFLNDLGRSVMPKYCSSFATRFKANIMRVLSFSDMDWKEFVLFIESKGFWVKDKDHLVELFLDMSDNVSDEFCQFCCVVGDFVDYDIKPSQLSFSVSVSKFYDEYNRVSFEFDRSKSLPSDFCSLGITFHDFFESNLNCCNSFYASHPTFVTAYQLFLAFEEFYSLCQERVEFDVQESLRQHRLLKHRFLKKDNYNSNPLNINNLFI